MSRRVRQALAFGLGGVAILVSLGVWQLQRLDWKLGVIAELEAKLSAPPAPLPADPTEAEDEYTRVAVSGRFLPGELHLLTSIRPWGPGFRVIAPFETDTGRRVLVDRGYVPEARKDAPRDPGAAEVTGALLWPDDAGWFTPDPDRDANIWFAREPGPMAEALGTEPLLIVAETRAGEGEFPAPRPATANLRNHHLEYALTWFSLAAIWAVMTAVLLLRLRRRETA